MKEELVRKILNKGEEIKLLNIQLNGFKQKLKGLTFNEYEIEDYIITIAMKMKKVKDRIHQLQGEVYELMQILRADNK